MKRILISGFLLTCLTLQCSNFIESVWQRTQMSALHAWDSGSRKMYAICDGAYSKMPSQEEAQQHCLNAIQWISQKTPVPVKEKINNAYQVSRETTLQGYTWAYENTPSQEELEQKSKEAFDVVKEKTFKAHQYLDSHTPEGLKRWVTAKKNFSVDISKKIYLNVSVWLSKLGTVIEQTNI